MGPYGGALELRWGSTETGLAAVVAADGGSQSLPLGRDRSTVRALAGPSSLITERRRAAGALLVGSEVPVDGKAADELERDDVVRVNFVVSPGFLDDDLPG